MDLHLSGKTAIVTGASKGIGLAITQALAAEGVHVTAAARHTGPELAKLATDGLVRPVEVDLAAPDGPAALVEAATSAFGGLDILVNNVGAVQPRTGGFLSVTDDDWISTLTINFLAAVRVTRAALPLLLDRGAGSIVTVSSVNASLPDPLVIDYSAAKAALASFSKSLSKEVGPRGVRVNTVSPGPVATALWLGDDGVAATIARTSGGEPGAVAEQAAAESVTGRFTRPDEVADLVLLLAGGRAGNVTGADFVIDGGLISTL
ncbi:3-oxoacyl-ACP reductase [Sphaerisporangium melleum]|uniref:3-oxoacyl-ACP reductase n=1 Tax=Sphaerisporangium melleum TaxID=321316 RepID=A0A917RM02_9ACTN|nr:oxidoreductase [Sphaerisporangium melleum]GGL14196.1 3-oxoacyl-ACP reductase [Sphaerisporangium melleum]GII68161.1 3-oxoacyl-ACP reductase [Sphaerisporangium melleum]